MAMTFTQTAKLLIAAGASGVRRQEIAAHVADGCPTNPHGTINLVAYTAWLLRRLGYG